MFDHDGTAVSLSARGLDEAALVEFAAALVPQPWGDIAARTTDGPERTSVDEQLPPPFATRLAAGCEFSIHLVESATSVEPPDATEPAEATAPCTRASDDTSGEESSSILIDDFESGTLEGWQVAAVNGGWNIYGDEQPFTSFPPAPPQCSFAAATEPTGPGTRLLYRDVALEGELSCT